MRMECPACHNPLSEISIHEVYIDLCTVCKGIWFDSDEMMDVLKKIVEEKLSVPMAGVPKKPEAAAETMRSCPRCKNRMAKYNYAYDSNVILDRCPHCRGIWADGGEIALIVQFLRKIQGR